MTAPPSDATALAVVPQAGLLPLLDRCGIFDFLERRRCPPILAWEVHIARRFFKSCCKPRKSLNRKVTSRWWAENVRQQSRKPISHGAVICAAFDEGFAVAQIGESSEAWLAATLLPDAARALRDRRPPGATDLRRHLNRLQALVTTELDAASGGLGDHALADLHYRLGESRARLDGAFGELMQGVLAAQRARDAERPPCRGCGLPLPEDRLSARHDRCGEECE